LLEFLPFIYGLRSGSKQGLRELNSLFPVQSRTARVAIGFDSTTLPIGKQISLPWHFDVPITLEGVRLRHPPETEPLFVKTLQRHFNSRGAQTVGGIVKEITTRRIVVNRARDNHVVSR